MLIIGSGKMLLKLWMGFGCYRKLEKLPIKYQQ